MSSRPAQMRLGLFADLGAARFDGGDLGLLFRAQVVGVFRMRLFLLRLGAFQRGGDQGFLGVFLGRGVAGFSASARAAAAFSAAGGGLGGELGGLFLPSRAPRAARRNSKRSRACRRRPSRFARPDFALGEAVVIDQRNVRRADVGAAAAFDAVEQVVFLRLAEIRARENQYSSKGCNRPGRPWRIRRSGCRAFPAAAAGTAWAMPTSMQLVALTTGTSPAARSPSSGRP
jgi:hypothetical protein